MFTAILLYSEKSSESNSLVRFCLPQYRPPGPRFSGNFVGQTNFMELFPS